MTASMLARVQDDFAAALIDAGREVPHGVAAYNSRYPVRRFAVYRNNVVVGLIDALRARFPATERIVGAEFFSAMARVFVTVSPPRSPLLMHYGDDFPQFIAGFEPAAEIDYLADVARLEAARTRAYHAADANPIDARALQRLDPAALARVRLVLHPSIEVVSSRHAIVTIWAMNSGEMELAPVATGRGEDALVIRPYLQVLVHRIASGGAALLQLLAAGNALGEAAETTAAQAPGFDLAENLAGLIGSGAVIAIAQVKRAAE